jgi:hypothetical protein
MKRRSSKRWGSAASGAVGGGPEVDHALLVPVVVADLGLGEGERGDDALDGGGHAREVGGGGGGAVVHVDEAGIEDADAVGLGEGGVGDAAAGLGGGLGDGGEGVGAAGAGLGAEGADGEERVVVEDGRAVDGDIEQGGAGDEAELGGEVDGLSGAELDGAEDVVDLGAVDMDGEFSLRAVVPVAVLVEPAHGVLGLALGVGGDLGVGGRGVVGVEGDGDGVGGVGLVPGEGVGGDQAAGVLGGVEEDEADAAGGGVGRGSGEGGGQRDPDGVGDGRVGGLGDEGEEEEWEHGGG